MATTTKKNRVVIARATGRSGKNRNSIPIEFRIEITPEKELGPITGRDSEGREYVVSFDLKSEKKGLPICCCKNKNRKVMECFSVPAGQRCPCKDKDKVKTRGADRQVQEVNHRYPRF